MKFQVRTSRGDITCALHRRRSGGRWHADFYVDGQRRRVGLKTTDFAMARGLATERILQATHSVSTGRLGLAQAVDQCLHNLYPDVQARVGHSGYTSAALLLRTALAEMGDIDLGMMASDMTARVQTYLDGLVRSGHAPVTIDNNRRGLHRLFSWLMARRLVPWERNPAARNQLDLPRWRASPKAPADPAAVEALMSAVREAGDHELYCALVLMQSGFRPIGVTRATWESIDLGAKPTVAIREKTRQRIIPLSSWAAGELRRHAGEGRVWPYGIHVLHTRIARLREAVGLPSALTAGAMRRMTYQRLYASGVAPQLAAKIMGNSVAVALKHYVDLETLDAHEAVENLAPGSIGSHKTDTKSKSENRH